MKVVLDDSSSRIQYQGKWETGVDSQFIGSSNGSPVQSTLHSTGTNGSSLTVDFEGSSVQVFGGLSIDITKGRGPPQWSCTVDGKPIDVHPPGSSSTTGTLSNVLLCDTSVQTIPAGPHTLAVTVSLPTARSNFFLDDIMYEPLPSGVSSDSGTVLFESEDSKYVTYDQGKWSETDGLLSTANPGASISINFIGTSISMFGSVSGGLNNTATYTLDQKNPQSFSLVASGSSGASPLANQQLFTIQSLPMGHHSLTVTHTGQKNGIPLTFDHFLVNTTSLAQTTGSTGSSTSNPPPPPGSSNTDSPVPPVSATSSRKGVVAGAVAGALIGAVVILGALFYLWYFRLRSRTSRSKHSPSTLRSESYFIQDLSASKKSAEPPVIKTRYSEKSISSQTSPLSTQIVPALISSPSQTSSIQDSSTGVVPRPKSYSSTPQKTKEERRRSMSQRKPPPKLVDAHKPPPMPPIALEMPQSVSTEEGHLSSARAIGEGSLPNNHMLS